MNVLHYHRKRAGLMSCRIGHTSLVGVTVCGLQNSFLSRLGRVCRLKTVVLSVALFWAMPLFARDKTDTIVMNNGDRFTCEIKALDSGILYVGFDYIAGTVSLDWSKVNRLESNQSFIVKTENGSVYTGILHTTGSTAGGRRPMQLSISETPEGGTEIAQPEVVRMTQTSDQFWQRLNGNINSGTTYSKGNQAVQYQLNATAQYPREQWSAGGAISSTLSSSTGSTVSTRNSLSLNARHLLRWDNWFYAGLGSLLQSSTQDIELQSNLGAGVGRYLKSSDHATVSVIGGLAYQNTNYTQGIASQAAQNVATLLLGANIEFFKFNKTNLTVKAIAFPAISEPGRIYFNTDVAYYVKLGHNITWNLSFYGNWDNEPPTHLSGSDYGTASGVREHWPDKQYRPNHATLCREA